MSSRFRKHSFSNKEWERKGGKGIPLSNLMEDHRTERGRGQIQTWRQHWDLSTCPLLLSWSLLSWQQLVSNLSKHKGEDCEWPLSGAPLRGRQNNGLSTTPQAWRGQEVDSSGGTKFHFLQFRELKWSPGGNTVFHSCRQVHYSLCPQHLG